jgi:hypothetical protein
LPAAVAEEGRRPTTVVVAVVAADVPVAAEARDKGTFTYERQVECFR